MQFRGAPRLRGGTNRETGETHRLEQTGSLSVHRLAVGVYLYGAIRSSLGRWRIPSELKHDALGTAARDAISWVFGRERGRPSIRPFRPLGTHGPDIYGGDCDPGGLGNPDASCAPRDWLRTLGDDPPRPLTGQTECMACHPALKTGGVTPTEYSDRYSGSLHSSGSACCHQQPPTPPLPHHELLALPIELSAPNRLFRRVLICIAGRVPPLLQLVFYREGICC